MADFCTCHRKARLVDGVIEGVPGRHHFANSLEERHWRLKVSCES